MVSQKKKVYWGEDMMGKKTIEMVFGQCTSILLLSYDVRTRGCGDIACRARECKMGHSNSDDTEWYINGTVRWRR